MELFFSFLNYFSAIILILAIACKCSNFCNYHTKIYLIYLSYFLTGCIVSIFSLVHNEKATNSFFVTAFNPFRYLFGIHYHVHNEETIDKRKGYIMVANHQHGIDAAIVAKVSVMSDNMVRTVVKQELRNTGPFGYGLAKAGAIFVNRASSEEGKAVMNKAGDRAKAENSSILIFPEGTRNNTTDDLLEFKKGAFHIAIDAGLPILPVVIGKYHFMDRRRRVIEPRMDVHIYILPPIETQGLTKSDIPELIKKTRDVMAEKFKATAAKRPEIPPEAKKD